MYALCTTLQEYIGGEIFNLTASNFEYISSLHFLSLSLRRLGYCVCECRGMCRGFSFLNTCLHWNTNLNTLNRKLVHQHYSTIYSNTTPSIFVLIRGTSSSTFIHRSSKHKKLFNPNRFIKIIIMTIVMTKVVCFTVILQYITII